MPIPDREWREYRLLRVASGGEEIPPLLTTPCGAFRLWLTAQARCLHSYTPQERDSSISPALMPFLRVSLLTGVL